MHGPVDHTHLGYPNTFLRSAIFIIFVTYLPKDIAPRLNKKELRLALKTRYISEVAKIAAKLSQWYVYRYRQLCNKLLPHFF
jgi:hypothetical protein